MKLQGRHHVTDNGQMRLLGWIAVAILTIGSLLYAGAVLVAVEIGGFIALAFVPPDHIAKTSPLSLYFEVLFKECRLPLGIAALLALLLLYTRPSIRNRKSKQRIDALLASNPGGTTSTSPKSTSSESPEESTVEPS